MEPRNIHKEESWMRVRLKGALRVTLSYRHWIHCFLSPEPQDSLDLEPRTQLKRWMIESAPTVYCSRLPASDYSFLSTLLEKHLLIPFSRWYIYKLTIAWLQIVIYKDTIVFVTQQTPVTHPIVLPILQCMWLELTPQHFVSKTLNTVSIHVLCVLLMKVLSLWFQDLHRFKTDWVWWVEKKKTNRHREML